LKIGLYLQKLRSKVKCIIYLLTRSSKAIVPTHVHTYTHITDRSSWVTKMVG